jgi:hypothetical protein
MTNRTHTTPSIRGASIEGLALSSLSLSMSANETNQISQGGRREQGDGAFIDTRLVIHVWHGEVGPPPGQGQHHAVLESDQHPRSVVAPEDTADATPPTAGRTLFRHDPEGGPTECNIRCSLSLG